VAQHRVTDGTLAAPQLLGEYSNFNKKQMEDRDGEVIKIKGAEKQLQLKINVKCSPLHREAS